MNTEADNHNILFHILRCAAVFLITLATAVCLLVLSAMIPRSAIKDNVTRSAEYFVNEENMFSYAIPYLPGSRQDHYADSILTSIVWNIDPSSPLSSVMKDMYYKGKLQNENENLYTSVTGNYEPNTQYMRYWHGSIIFLRPLFCIFSIQGIYIWHLIVLIVLAGLLLMQLFRSGEYALSIGIIVALIMTMACFIPFTLEYTWTIMLTLVISNIIIFRFKKLPNTKAPVYLFLICGMLTCFFDFLTTETLTLLVPLIILLKLTERIPVPSGYKNRAVYMIKTAFSLGTHWIFGYVFMWLSKWALAAAILGENVMPYVTSHISERIGGSVSDNIIGNIFASLGNNIRSLIPFCFGEIGVAIGIMALIIIIYICFVYRKKDADIRAASVLLIIGIVPYLRYMLVLNHSYLHYFFTFRAQMAGILAISVFMAGIVDWRCVFHEDKRKRKS